MVMQGAVAAPAHAREVTGVGALGFSKKLFSIFGIVLAFCNANLACAVTGLAAVESERAGVVFFSRGGDMWAGHETVCIIEPGVISSS